MSLIRSLLFGLFFFLFLSFSSGQNVQIVDVPEIEVEVLEPEQEGILSSHPGLYVYSVFPKSSETGLLGGEIIEILLGVSNDENQTSFNVTHIEASLHAPNDFEVYIQNFTRLEYGAIVGAGDQLTIAYYFRPDALLESRDYGFSASVFYHDHLGNNYTSTFFNGTVLIAEPDALIDTQTFFVSTTVLGALGLAGFLGYKFQQDKKRKARRAVARSYQEQGTIVRSEEEVNEWLEGTSAAVRKPKNSPLVARAGSKDKKKK